MYQSSYEQTKEVFLSFEISYKEIFMYSISLDYTGNVLLTPTMMFDFEIDEALEMLFILICIISFKFTMIKIICRRIIFFHISRQSDLCP
jgi:hypothetical protein